MAILENMIKNAQPDQITALENFIEDNPCFNDLLPIIKLHQKLPDITQILRKHSVYVKRDKGNTWGYRHVKVKGLDHRLNEITGTLIFVHNKPYDRIEVREIPEE